MTLSILAPEKFFKLPDVVLMDLDNTLYAYDPCHEAALAETRAKAEKLVSITPADFDLLLEKARKEVKTRLGRTAASHSRLLYFQRLIELAGLKSQALTALDLEQTYWRTFLGKVRLFDDALEFLDDLRLASIPVAVVTDLTAQIQFRKLVHFGLDRYIDYVVTSEEAGVDKPSPVPFNLALEKMGVADDVTIWAVGDDPAAEMAAVAAFKNAVSIQKLHPGVRPCDPAPHASFRNFGDLRALLTKLKPAS